MTKQIKKVDSRTWIATIKKANSRVWVATVMDDGTTDKIKKNDQTLVGSSIPDDDLVLESTGKKIKKTWNIQHHNKDNETIKKAAIKELNRMVGLTSDLISEDAEKLREKREIKEVLGDFSEYQVSKLNEEENINEH